MKKVKKVDFEFNVYFEERDYRGSMHPEQWQWTLQAPSPEPLSASASRCPSFELSVSILLS